MTKKNIKRPGLRVAEAASKLSLKKYKLSNSDRGLNKNLMLHSYQIKFMIIYIY